MGQEHARHIKESIEMRVAVVVEPNEENFESISRSFIDSEVRLFTDLADAISLEQVDGWIISSPTSSHVQSARILLEGGQRVLLEKPIAESLENAKLLQDLVQADSANLMMGHILLWSPEFQELRNKVQPKGAIREIKTLRQRSQSHRIDYPNESLFSLLMVHDLYCIQALTLGKEPLKVAGRTRNHQVSGIDFAKAELVWADSTVATAEANYFLANDPPGLIDDEISVRGDDWSECVHFRSNFTQALRNELAHFAALLRGEVAVPIGARYQDALQIQGWVDALISSAAVENYEGE